MFNSIYHDKDGFNIIKQCHKGKKQNFILINTKKVFKEGHTHISNYYMCKHLIYCCKNKIIDDKINSYLIDSLIRINNDLEFEKKLIEYKLNNF